jgi:hypothetical protein
MIRSACAEGLSGHDPERLQSSLALAAPAHDPQERDVLEDFIFPDPPQKFGEGVNGHVL